jgi:non-ribosomal peptide synthetase component F
MTPENFTSNRGPTKPVLVAEAAESTPASDGLAQLFDIQMRTRPGAIAIRTRDEAVSYVELHARANRLANVLRAAGVGVETAVGILMGSCVEHIVAQVAICKVGATCVPLDPEYPRECIAGMIRDAGASLIITNASSCDMLDMVPNAQRLCVDADAARILRGSSVCPMPTANADARSHILFTFGSTGQPERIDVLARDVVRLVHETVQSTAHDPVARDAGLASVPFDATLGEVWGPLLCGGRIVLVPVAHSSS